MNSRKTLYQIENLISILQVLILLYCTFLQVISCSNLQLPLLRDLPAVGCNVAAVFLQVDATILALTIALVTLISGSISDAYMGISYSDYFLNLRPKHYKQIVLIFLSFLYFAIAALLYLLGLYYMVCAFLFCEILLIMFSTLSLYSIFQGKFSIQKEIAEYSLALQLCKTENETKL